MTSVPPAPPPGSVPLHSDHVNYLVWRYLQEQGYSHAAVQLMREWNGDPQSLSFASDVKPADLVSVIQDGIMYDHVTASIESRDKRYQFIVEKKRKAARSIAADSRGKHGDPAHTRKRPKLDGRGSTRGRVAVAVQTDSDGVEVERNGSPMQVDSNDAEIRKEESPPRPSTLSIGMSSGMQHPPPAKTLTRLHLPGADILNVSWGSGNEPHLFATGGYIWHSWKLGPLLADEVANTEVPPVHQHAPTGGVFSVSASSRSSEAQVHALAYADEDNSVILFESEGETPLRTLVNHEGSAILVRWDSSGSRLLAIFQKAHSAEVSVWTVKDKACFANVDTMLVAEDAAWAQDDHFILCGNGFIILHKLEPGKNEGKTLDETTSVKSISTDCMYAFVKYDRFTKKAACAAPDDGHLRILGMDDFTFQTKASHGAQITAIEWDDSINDSSPADENNTRLLFSSAADGSVKVWNAYSSLEMLFALSMTQAVPAMTLAASNGYIAAAGEGQISVWKVCWPKTGNGSPDIVETTIWHADSQTKEEQSKIGWPLEEAPFHELAWHSHHNLIAYSIGNQIHVIQVP